MSALVSMMSDYRNRYGMAIVYLLGWLATSDGRIDERERRLLADSTDAFLGDRGAVDAVISLAKRANSDDLVIASRELRSSTDPLKTHVVFELILAMAMVDGVFSIGENHVVRFLGDVMGLSRTQFRQSFREVTGREPPDPGDLSSADWWRQREEQARERRRSDEPHSGAGGNAGSRGRASASSGTSGRRSQALAALGLEATATREEIKAAYRRLAKVHHPDRFEGLSEEVVAAAALSFRRIREAYEYLVQRRTSTSDSESPRRRARSAFAKS